MNGSSRNLTIEEGIMDPDLRRRFLTNTDETGRFIVSSKRTGKTYFVEPLAGKQPVWGDLDPATKKLQGNYGQKYRGAVPGTESLIRKENGFKNIVTLEAGTSPLAYIDMIDAQYPDRQV
jgi:hypothetical protein